MKFLVVSEHDLVTPQGYMHDWGARTSHVLIDAEDADAAAEKSNEIGRFLVYELGEPKKYESDSEFVRTVRPII